LQQLEHEKGSSATATSNSNPFLCKEPLRIDSIL
jgi:hypothetical protein